MLPSDPEIEEGTARLSLVISLNWRKNPETIDRRNTTASGRLPCIVFMESQRTRQQGSREEKSRAEALWLVLFQNFHGISTLQVRSLLCREARRS